MTSYDEPHYTFGDSDTAAERLAWLAHAYDASSGAWLDSLGLARGLRVVDLGCGPGFTTALLDAHLAPASLHGLDLSDRLVARAKDSAAASRADFHVHDVTRLPFPVTQADVLYVRFLLTHLAEPARILTAWSEAVVPGGRLLLEETAGLRSSHPDFVRYYAKVEALQAHYGQSLYIGARLGEIAQATPWTLGRARVAIFELPAQTMARLHSLNLRTWSHDPYARAAFDPDELSALEAALHAIACGASASPVTCELAQVELVRPPT